MSKINGGQIITKFLVERGVKYIFTLSGAHIFPIYNACVAAGIHLVSTRHEQAAVHMAEAWARATGEPGVCLLTAGPGVTNGITGIVQANHSRVPVIIIAGKASLRDRDRGQFHELEVLEVVKPLVKWAGSCYQTERLEEYTATAFRQALAGRPGVAFLEVPTDILSAEVDESKVFSQPWVPPAVSPGDPRLIRQAVRALEEAERPVILAGDGVFWSRAGEALTSLAEKRDIPVFTHGLGRGCVPEDHCLCFGRPTSAAYRASAAIPEADVILALGVTFDYSLKFGGEKLIPQKTYLIQVDPDPASIGFNRAPNLAIAGDVSLVIGQLLEELPRKTGQVEWLSRLLECEREARMELLPMETREGAPIHQLRLMRELADFIDRDAIVVADGGDISFFALAELKANTPGSWIDSGPTVNIGHGIPMGIAAKLAYPHRQVVVINGDGSFGMNCMEFDTAVREKTPIISIIGNDAAWGMMKHVQEQTGSVAGAATDLGYGSYEQVVQALGGYGELVVSPEQIRPAMERAMASGLPACLNVLCDPNAASRGASWLASTVK
ncbi:MAG: thiamine pyrophosphate-binding protein [Bacillota bacterium]